MERKKVITFAPAIETQRCCSLKGEMVQWSITTVLKTVVLNYFINFAAIIKNLVINPKTEERMNKKLFVTLVCGFIAFADAMAQKPMAWNTPELNQENREQRRDHFFAFESETLAQKGDKAASARYLSMEGMWKFNFVKNYYDRPADFFKLQYDDSKWVEFPVPGLFEINGYGDRIYRNVGDSWSPTVQSDPPYSG